MIKFCILVLIKLESYINSLKNHIYVIYIDRTLQMFWQVTSYGYIWYIISTELQNSYCDILVLNSLSLYIFWEVSKAILRQKLFCVVLSWSSFS